MASKLNLSSPYAKITRNLHLFMLILCAIASIALYIVQSWLSKAILTLILIAYAAFLIRNSQIFTLLFRITGTQGIPLIIKLVAITLKFANGATLQLQTRINMPKTRVIPT